MKILAVIPARAGSKGIRHKNMRLLNEKPLIYYSVRNAVESGCFEDITVTTDDDDIIAYIKSVFPDVRIRHRSRELSLDDITLDPVVYDACISTEETEGKKYEAVVTLQPTSPTLKADSLKKALDKFIKGGFDTVISVKDATHLEWLEKDGRMVPAYERRLNRQWLPRKFCETGAFLITRRELVTPESRIGANVSVFELDRTESVDIDSVADWMEVQALMNRKKYLIVTSGNKTLGMGHIYRMLTLAESLLGNGIKFLLVNSDDETARFLTNEGWEAEKGGLEDAGRLLDEYVPDIVINDFLDTPGQYVKEIADRGFFTVNFEDLGEGASYAHLVINALYELSNPPANHRFGSSYVCLNRRFTVTPPSVFRETPETMMITFGGVDLNNLTLKTLSALPDIFERTPIREVFIILGPAYAHTELLARRLPAVEKKYPGKIQVLRDVKNMAHLMSRCDVAVTSNGRTVYELAAMNVPAISIAQNDRETLHLFARYNPGIRYLGIACNVNTKIIRDEIIKITTDPRVRGKMFESLMLADISRDADVTKNEIEQSFRRWKIERDLSGKKKDFRG